MSIRSHKRPTQVPLLWRATLLALSLVLVLQPVGAAAAGLAQTYRTLGLSPGSVRQSFSFVVASDSHVGYGPATRNSSAALSDLLTRYEDTSFMIHMGDLTETGSEAEYREAESLLSSLPYPVIATMGNHEARWQDPQGSLFRAYMGSPNTSFNWGAWHFVVLDTTYPGQTLGTLEPYTLKWLEEDLAKNPGRPAAVFSHHPLLYLESEFQDSDAAFARIVDKYPVRVVFSGHGHSFINWRAQGQRFQMVGALMDGAYARVSVNGLSMTVKSVAPDMDGVYQEQVIWQADVAPAAKPGNGNPVTSLSASTQDGALEASMNLSRPADLYFQIDNGGFVTLGRRASGAGSFTIDVSKHSKGRHTLNVKAVTAEGPFFTGTEFVKDAGDLLAWQVDLGSAVVGEIIQKGPQEVIVGTRDGLIRSLRVSDGAVLWTFDALSQWGGGFLDGNKLYFGTADGDFCCVDASEGSFVWKMGLDESGFSSPPAAAATTAGKLVIVASTAGRVYGLNAFHGGRAWRFDAKGAIVSQPVVHNSSVYFGSWDTNLYALDVSSGDLIWSAQLGRQVYYAPYLTPAASGGTIFATTTYDASTGGSFLYAFDAATGEQKWKTPGKSSFMSPHAAPGSLVTVMDASGTVWAFSQSDGALQWSKPGSGTLFSDSQGSGPRFVTGGYRGVLGFLSAFGRADFTIGDGHLFVSPLLITSGSPDSGAVVLVADTRGSLFRLAFPQ